MRFIASRAYEIAFELGAKLNKNFASTFDKAQSVAEKTVSKIKKTVVALGAMAIGAASLGNALETYKDFEQAMANTAAVAGVQKGTEGYAKLEKAALEAGAATSKTAQESAEALGYMALAGWSVEDSMKGLMPVLRLSEATGADLAQTSDLVTDSMAALGLGVDDLSQYLDVAALANNKSNQTATHLLEAYIGVGGVFKSFNTDITESAALLGVLANRGIKGSEAGNKMNAVLINLTKKGGESADALEALNISAYDSKGNFKGVTKVLEELNGKTKNLTEEQRNTYLQMIGGKTQLDTLNALMSGLNTTTADGANELQYLRKALENADGSLDQMAFTINNSMNGAFERLSSAVDDFKIKMVKEVAPQTTLAIDKLAEVIPEGTQKAAAAFRKLVNVMIPVGKFVIENRGSIAAFISGIGIAFATYKIADQAIKFTTAIKTLGTLKLLLPLLVSNPIAFGIAAIGGALVTTSIAIQNANKRMKKENLSMHFGSLALSMSETDEIAERLVQSKNLEKVQDVLSRSQDLGRIKSGIKDIGQAIDKLNFKSNALNLQLSSDEKEEYLKNIKSLVAQSQNLLNDESFNLNRNFDFLSNSTSGQKIIDNINAFYKNSEGELTRLGEELNNAVNASFEDGLLTIDETKKINDLRTQIANITQQITTDKFGADLEVMKFNFDLSDLDGESFKNFQDSLNTKIGEARKQYDEAYALQIAQAKSMLSNKAINNDQFNEMMYAAQGNYLDNLTMLQTSSVQAQVDVIYKAYESELTAAGPEFKALFDKTINDMIESAEFNQDGITATNIEAVIQEISKFKGLDKATSANLKDMYANLAPVLSGMDDLKNKYVDMGREVPEALSKGILDASTLGALTGDAGSIFTIAGSSLSEANPAYIQMIDTARKRGEEVPAGLVAGMELQYPQIETAGTNIAQTLIGSIERGLAQGVNANIPMNVNSGGAASHWNLPISKKLPGYAKGTNYSANTFIAGEQGAELITNRTGSKVFTDIETGRIFDNLNNLQNSIFGDYEKPKNPFAVQTKSNTTDPVTVAYAPSIEITVQGDGNKAEIESTVMDVMRQGYEEIRSLVRDEMQRQQSKKERLSNA